MGEGPSVSSLDYQAEGWAGTAGRSGRFTFTAAPGTDPTTFVFSLDAQSFDRQIAVTRGSATVVVEPPTAGTHTLYVRAKEAGGDVLPGITTYEFGVGVGAAVAARRTVKSLAAAGDDGPLTQVLPLAQRYLESRTAVFTGQQPGAALARWAEIVKRDMAAVTEVGKARELLAADGIEYANATVRLTDASIQEAGDGVALHVTESTTLTPPVGSSLPESGYAAERVFIFQPRDGSWFIADQKLVNGGAIPPMTEPVSEYVPVPVKDSADVVPLTAAEVAEASSIDPGGADPVKADKDLDVKASSRKGLTKAADSTFDYKAAIAYADEYWLKPGNTFFAYIDGNDCANFVSQAMQAGGWEYVKGDRDSDQYWYYGTPYTSKASLTFINAHSLYRFAKSRTSVLTDAYDARGGDIVMFDREDDGVIDHSMIVTFWDKEIKSPLLTYHSNDQHNVSLTWVKSIHVEKGYSKVKYYALRT